MKGDPNKSDLQIGSSGDRIYLYFHRPGELTKELSKNDFEEIKVFKVEYKKKEKKKTYILH